MEELKMLTREEVAEFLHVHVNTVSMLREVGIIDGIKTGKNYMFPQKVIRAFQDDYIGLDVSNKNDFEVLKLLNEYTNIEIPNNLKGLDVKKVIHNKVCNKEKMKESLLEFLKENKN